MAAAERRVKRRTKRRISEMIGTAPITWTVIAAAAVVDVVVASRAEVVISA